MKRVFQLILLVAIVGLSYWVYTIISTPLDFQAEKTTRETAVVSRLKEIRDAQRAFKSVNGRYVSTFDSLITFIKNDSLTFEIKIGSEDDSVAVAQGKVQRVKVRVAVIDTLFGKKDNFAPDEIRYIPFTDKQEFIMGSGNLTTESKIVVPVFEARAPYKAYLGDLDQQQLINLIDFRKSIDRYPGLKVGSLTEATNDAGNWEN